MTGWIDGWNSLLWSGQDAKLREIIIGLKGNYCMRKIKLNEELWHISVGENTI